MEEGDQKSRTSLAMQNVWGHSGLQKTVSKTATDKEQQNTYPHAQGFINSTNKNTSTLSDSRAVGTHSCQRFQRDREDRVSMVWILS